MKKYVLTCIALNVISCGFVESNQFNEIDITGDYKIIYDIKKSVKTDFTLVFKTSDENYSYLVEGCSEVYLCDDNIFTKNILFDSVYGYNHIEIKSKFNNDSIFAYLVKDISSEKYEKLIKDSQCIKHLPVLANLKKSKDNK